MAPPPSQAITREEPQSLVNAIPIQVVAPMAPQSVVAPIVPEPVVAPFGRGPPRYLSLISDEPPEGVHRRKRSRTSDGAGKQKEVVIRPSTLAPSSSSQSGGKSTSSLPPPSGAALRCDNIWCGDVIPAGLAGYIEPPSSFLDPAQFSDSELPMMRALSISALRAASLVGKYCDLKESASKIAAELSSSTETLGKVREELRICQENYGKATTDLSTAKLSLEKSTADLKKASEDLVDSQRRLAECKEARDRNRHTNNFLLQKMYDQDAKILGLEHDKGLLKAEMKGSVEAAFANCLAQLRFLNPGVTFNVEKMHPRAYVGADGFIEAPIPALPEIDEEDGDEESDDEVELADPPPAS